MLSPAIAPDADTPLADVTFCVVDLETTGGAPQTDAITEIGAVLVRGGETLGTFQTFVHPGIAIPARVSYLTGITEQMIGDAPRPESVLPTFLEFLGNAVIVGHNVRFDLGFLNAALTRAGFPRLSAPTVDTCTLARRLVRDEVPDCRLGTLAQWLRLDHRPSHRGLTDALATTDLLHHLIGRAAGYGVFRLDDLLALPTIAGHPFAAKLKLTDGLPRRPGVYEFLDRDGSVVYVGKATNLRQRVRSYFGSDDRRTIRPLLTSLHSVRHRESPNPLVAEITELRLLHAGRPRFNRAGALPTRPAWVRLTDDAFPRLATGVKPVSSANALGPFTTLASARLALEAIESVVLIRRCDERLRSTVPVRLEPCPSAQLGVSVCPCSGSISPPRYAELVAAARRTLCHDPAPVLAALHDRMTTLAVARRFEEAAITRDRIRVLAHAHRERRIHRALTAEGRLELQIDGAATIIAEGRLALDDIPAVRHHADRPDVLDPADVAESRAIVRWLVRYPTRWSTLDAAHDRELLERLTVASAQMTVAPD